MLCNIKTIPKSKNKFESQLLQSNLGEKHKNIYMWSKPLHFCPEKFLPGGRKANSNFEIILFGADRRICARMSLGLQMVQLLTATFVYELNMD